MFSLSGAAAGGADALQELLAQKFLEMKQRQLVEQQQRELAETVRQADMRNAVAQRELGQGDQRIGLDRDKFGEDKRQFDTSAGFKGREVALEEQMQPARIRHLGAQTADIERKPQAEQQERDFITGRDRTQHGFDLGKIRAQGDQSARVASIRHPDDAATQKEANEAQQLLSLIDEVERDPSLAAAVGALDGRGLGRVADPNGYERVKAKHDQIVGLLQLAQGGKLKGQGQVSNIEREMLRQASTALTRTLAEGDYRKELGKLRTAQSLRGGAAPAPAAGGEPKVGDVKTFPNGAKGVWDGQGWVKR